MSVWKPILSCLTMLLTLSPGYAQTPEPRDGPAENSEQETAHSKRPHFRVEVVAPPVLEGNSTDRYGSLITAVTEAQITDLNAQDLSSALRRVPGVSVSRYNLIGAYGGADGGAVYIRGQGSGRPGDEISILMDGVPRFVGVWTHPLLDTIDVDSIRRIDIYKSPQPVLLGNMAFAAVNILPRVHEREGFSGRYGAAYGEFGTVVQRVQIGG
ncbi:MAG: Plug domain-containing protein, partial [Acidobacteriota bacterium]